MQAKQVLKGLSESISLREDANDDVDTDRTDAQDQEGGVDGDDEVVSDIDDEEELEGDEEDPDKIDPETNSMNKVKKLALKYGKGKYSYLYWPVAMDIDESPKLHITAKFFGDVPLTVDEVRNILESIPGFDEQIDISELEWEPVVFATQNDGGVAVLELKKYPSILDRVHAAMSKFRKDDYDTYKPHITVSQETWERIQTEGLSPSDAGLDVGPLELNIKGLTVYQWGEEAGPVEEIDGEDVSTNNPTSESMVSKAMKSLKNLKSI